MRLEGFEEEVKLFAKEIEEKSEEELKGDWIDSGWLWWDEVHKQYVFLRAIFNDDGSGRLVWVGNGRTAYDGHFDFEDKQELLEILENITDYIDF